MTVAGASAAVPNAIELKAVDVDAKTIGLKTVDAATSVKEASEMKLSKTPVNKKERVASSKFDASKIKRSKARVKKANDYGLPWKSVGEGKFTDPLLSAPYSRISAQTYKVEVQTIDLDYCVSEGMVEEGDYQGLDKIVRIVNIQKNNPLIGNGWDLIDENEDAYIIFDYTEGNDCVMMWDCELNASDEGDKVYVTQVDEYGYYEPENGKFIFPAGSLIVGRGTDPWDPEVDESNLFATSEDMIIQMPGYDFESHITAMNGYCATDDIALVNIEKGADGMAFSIILNGGMFDASEDNLNYILANFQNNLQKVSQSGYYKCNMSRNDWYSWFIIGTDKEGKVKSFEVAHFYSYAHNPEEWTSLGKALFTDDTMGDMMGSEGTLQQAEVEVLKNKINPGLYRLVNPYTEDLEWLSGCPFFLHGYYDEVEHTHYIDIDATDPEAVFINLTPTGMDFSEFAGDQILLVSRKGYEGKLVDNKITFPVDGILAYMGDGAMLANRNGNFSVEFTFDYNITVTATYGTNPIAGAYVSTYEGSEIGGSEARTDEAGKATIGVNGTAGDKVTIFVYKDGYITTPEEVEVTLADEKNITINAPFVMEALPASLTIIVSDEEGEPLEGALVNFNDEETITNENGQVKYTLSAPDVIGKKVAFTVYKDGYDFYEGEADFTETMDAWATVELKASVATANFKVFFGEDPVEGVAVTIEGKEAVTDENGSAKVELSAPAVIGKKVAFTAYKDGYDFYEGEADFTEGFEAYPVVKLKASVATATFKVLSISDDDVEVLEGVAITIDGKEAVTDENGSAKVEFSGPAVIGKKVAFTAYKDGYKFYEGVVDFTESLEAYTVVELEAEEATLTVIVSDKEEEHVADATVTCGDKTVTTDENGKAVFTFNALDVLFKSVDFTVTKTGYITYNGKADFTEGLEAYGIVTLEKDKTEGITLIEIENDKDLKVYDLNGRSVEHPALGNVYIINGKKIRIME